MNKRKYNAPAVTLIASVRAVTFGGTGSRCDNANAVGMQNDACTNSQNN